MYPGEGIADVRLFLCGNTSEMRMIFYGFIAADCPGKNEIGISEGVDDLLPSPLPNFKVHGAEETSFEEK